MEWWRRLVKKAMVVVRLKPRKYGRGIIELKEEVQTCGYRDVQVMWEMLRGSELKAQQHNEPIQSPSKK